MLMDIVVIGGGPGGYTAAIKAAQLGAKVLLVEKDSLGGTCLNRGCIPTKTLYRNAEILNLLKKSNEFGINVEGYNFDIEKMHERKNGIINSLREGINQLLKANKIEVMCGDAHIKNKNTVMVVGENTEVEVETKNIIIATGSKPAILGVEGAELDGVYTSEEMLEFLKLPEKLAVIGGGVIGMEFAGIFNSMGSKVSVIEFLPSILAPVDSDLTKRLSPMLKKAGIDVFTSTKVKKIEKKDENLVVLAEGKKGEIEFVVDAVLMSVGRVPHTEGLNLDEIGILYDRKGIKVDENYMTNIDGIYAIGDVNGINMLAHAAAHQGIGVAQSILGLGEKNHKQNVPGCIFIFPEISMIGITENEAKEKGIDYTTSKFLFGANGKALTLGEGEGMVKIIASKEDDKILGVHIMGPHASDLIHEGILAVNLGLSAKEVGSVIHAHPTLAEAFSEAVLGINGEAIHMVPKRK